MKYQRQDSSARPKRRAISSLLVLALSALFLVFVPAPAVASTTCSYNPLTLEVLISISGNLEVVTIARTAGGTFQVSSDQGGPASADCNTAGTPARVSNVAKVVVESPGAASDADLIIDMTNGRFEPGVGGPAETGGTSEIEWDIDLGDETGTAGDTLWIVGTQGDDVIRFGTVNDQAVINLNNDNDADITLADDTDGSSAEALRALGQNGNDTLSGQGGGAAGTPVGIQLDRLSGGAGNDILEGGNDATDTVDFGNNAGTSDTYLGAPTGVTVDLSITSQQNTLWGLDTINFVEWVRGSENNDVLKGNAGPNRILGAGGNDKLLYSPGADQYRGNAGTQDIADFSGFAGPVTSTICADILDVVCPDVTVAGADGQQVRGSTEGITGTEADDTLTGNQQPNIIDGGGGNDILRGAGGDDRIIPGTGNDVVSGDSGTGNTPGSADTLDFSGAVTGITVDLTITTEQNTGQGLDTIGEIEHVTGSVHNDSIRGDGGRNTLTGGSGDDSLDGAAEDDTLIGGPGNDTLTGGGGLDDLADYTGAASAVSVDLDAGTASSATEGNDTLLTIQNVNGTAFNDTLKGDGADNALTGLAGNDLINGRGGIDTLAGGAGNDTVSYENAPAGVTVSLATNTATGGDGNDTLAGFENVTGSNFADDITGDGAANVLKGLAGSDTELDGGGGNDTLNGGSGNDTLTGGDGIDTATYENAPSGVTVDLGQAAPQSSGGDGNDTIATVENVTGSLFNDNLTGDGMANVLMGLAGVDELDGALGNDTLIGGLGNDMLTGGDGTDTVSYADAPSAVTVDLGGAAPQATGGGGNDEIVTVENVTGSQFDDQLTGDGGANALIGGFGDDTLEGADGDDSLDGSEGTDTVSYENAGAGVMVDIGVAGQQNTGGAGNDTIANTENLTGSAFADDLRGSSGANLIKGLGGVDVMDGALGDDTLNGGLGDDDLTGGVGDDTATYEDAGGSVAVNLGSAAPQTSGADGNDTLSTIENVTGSDFDDELTGDPGSNILSGLEGKDMLAGGAGMDILIGGLDNDDESGGPDNDRLDQEASINGGDKLNGGTGSDTVDYLARANPVSVTSDGQANDGETGEGDNVGSDVESVLLPEICAPQIHGVEVVGLMAYLPSFSGGVFVAAGEVTGDGTVDIVTGADSGGGPHVRVLSKAGAELAGFFAYSPGFTGGVRVATGDINGDGVAEIVTAPGVGGGPHVRVVDKNNATKAEWMAYSPSFTGGVFVAAGDVDGDNDDEVITGAGEGGGPHVRVWDFTLDGSGNVTGITEKFGFMAYSTAFSGGVRVASGQVIPGAADEVVTAPGPGGGPHVRVLEVSGGTTVTETSGFMAYSPSFSGGVYVGVGDYHTEEPLGGEEIVTGPDSGGGPHVRVFRSNGTEIFGFFAYNPGFSGGIRVASGDVDPCPPGSAEEDLLTAPGPGGGPHVRILR